MTTDSAINPPSPPAPGLVLITMIFLLAGAVVCGLAIASQGPSPGNLGLAGLLVVLLLVSLAWGRRHRAARLLQLKCCFAAGVVLVLLGTLEGGARLAGYAPAPYPPRRGYWVADPELGFACRPQVTFRFLTPSGWNTGHTDAAGFRPTLAGADQPDAPIILCLGDSTTFSTEVADDQTWPEAAARQLARNGQACRLVNRGRPGYSGLQCLLVLRQALQDPQLVRSLRGVVYLWCSNDPAENFDNRTIPRPILQATSDGGFEIVREQFHGPLVPMSPLSWIQDHSGLAAALRARRFQVSPAAYRQGATEVLEGTVEFLQRFEDEAPLQEGMGYVLAQLRAECARQQAPLYVAVFPYPVWEDRGPAHQEIVDLLELSPTALEQDCRRHQRACERLRQLTEAAGGRYLELRGCLNGMTYRDYAASPYDWHYGPPALERIGQAVAQGLRR